MDDAASIDEVIERLDALLASAKANRSRLGCFPALYRKVTLAVKDRIAADFFDDAARMEQLDVNFANRYLRAIHQYENGERTTAVWRFAFEVTEHWWPIVLQHLLLGMNAHINLDLGIAAIRTVGPKGLPALHDDFNRINQVLAELVGSVEQELAEIWPLLRIANRFLHGEQEAIINFSMNRARDAAWDFAAHLATLGPPEQEEEIRHHDADMLELAKLIRFPGLVLGTVTKFVRLGERGSVPEIIRALE